MKNRTISVKGTEVTVTTRHEQDYISLTDMIKGFGDETVLYGWLRNKNTVEFLGIWEQLNNPDFKPLEFDRFMKEAGLNRFSLSPTKWVEATGAIGIYSKAGRGGGTFAHKDIAFEPACGRQVRLLAEPGVQVVPDHRVPAPEGSGGGYAIAGMELPTHPRQGELPHLPAGRQVHTDAIKEHLTPPVLSREQMDRIYSSEADLLNMALFGMTASEWRSANPKGVGNMRDHATLEQLVVLSNMESINALLIRQGLDAPERLRQLNGVAITQMKSLMSASVKRALGRPGRKAGS